MRGESARSRVILDASVLFREESLGWMEDPELQGYLVISDALWSRLGEAGSVEQFAPYAEPDPQRVQSVREAIEANAIARFSYAEALDRGELPDGAREVCESLLASEEPLADVLADEWAFLASQSLGIIAGARRALEAFARAGARVYEVADSQMVEALELARNRIPPGLLKRMKQTGRATQKVPDLILIGGEIAATVFVPPLGMGLAVAHLLSEGNAVLAGDP